MDFDVALVDELRSVHAVHTVILYGSYVRGDATPESDIDVAGFADVSEVLRDARIWDGRYLDGFVYPTSNSSSPPAEEMLKFRAGMRLSSRSSLCRWQESESDEALGHIDDGVSVRAGAPAEEALSFFAGDRQ